MTTNPSNYVEEIESVLAKPDVPNFIDSFRSIGYSLETAIADIIDNSIGAGSTLVKINMPRTKCHRLTILDNGSGMSQETLLEAMRFGSHPNVNRLQNRELGRFGLGLKSASLSQCRCLTVITKEKGQDLQIARWDLDFVSLSNEWLLQRPKLSQINHIPEIDLLLNQGSGTLVIWEDFDLMMQDFRDDFENPALEKRLIEVKEHLRLVFHRFIEDKELEIQVNESTLSPRDPFLKIVRGKRVQTPYPASQYELSGQKIFVQPWILPHPSKLSKIDLEKAGDLQNNQGFYIYRCKRLIIWGSWFHLQPKTELSRLARIQVDIPSSPELDKIWNLDIKKSKAVLPLQLRETLKKQIENLRGRSDRTFSKRSKRDITQGGLWVREENEFKKAVYSLNLQHDLLANLIKQNPQLRTVFKLISLFLPINALYEDVARDRQIALDAPEDLDEVVKLKDVGLSDELIDLYRKVKNEFGI